MKILETVYIFSKTLRETVLVTMFGWVSQCKHTPTCGEYTIQTIKKEGLLPGILKGCSRIVRCW